EPEHWDLKFTRYNIPVEDPSSPGVYLDYRVTGVLTRPGTEVAVATNIDPETVAFEDFADSLTNAPDAIGYEWKAYDFGSMQYTVTQNEVYFVKTVNDEVYKIQFLDFEGSSTGVTTFRITLEEVISALEPQEYI